jgi:DNA-binding transcriptional LysR family regulator
LALHARRVFSSLEQAREDAAKAASHDAQRLRLATVTTVAEQVIAHLLRGFREEAPAVDVDLFVANRERVWNRLRNWEADLAVGGRPPQEPAFRTLAVRANELLLVRAPDYEPSYGQATWLLRESGSGTRAATQGLLASIGIEPATLTIGSNSAIRECVRAGIGVSLLSRETVEGDLQTGALIVAPAPGTPLARNWHLLAPADRDVSSVALRFAQYAVQTGAFEVYCGP